MLYLMLIVSFIFAYFSPIVFNGYVSHTELKVLSYIFIIGSLLANIFTHSVFYYNQCENLEKLNEIRADKKTYKKRSEVFLAQLRNLLVEVYPQHEKDIFDKINNQTATTVFTIYPEIKSNETINHYVKQLVDIGDKTYHCDLKMNEIIKNLEFRKRISRIWIYSGFLPTEVKKKNYEEFYE